MHTPALLENTGKDFSIIHSISDSWTMSNFHFHDSYEILFSLSSTTKFFVEDTMYNVERGDLFVVNNMELHRTVAPSNVNYERYVVSFNPKYVDGYSTEATNLLKCFEARDHGFSNKIHLSEDQIHVLVSLLKRIEYYHSNNVFGSDVYRRISFIELLLMVNSFYFTSDSGKKNKASGDFKKIEQLLEYINQHLNENLTLDALASVFYLNKYYLSHLFKENTGFSVNEYIINRRILKSRELLKQNISVSEVSELVGFNNYCHFIRTFKNLVGVSPKQYSKQL